MTPFLNRFVEGVSKLLNIKWRVLVALTLITTLPRLPFIIFIQQNPTQTIAPDSSLYNQLALNLLKHGVFSGNLTPPFNAEVNRTPIYPLFLAGIYYSFCGSLSCPQVAVAIQQILLATLCTLLTYTLALFIFDNNKFTAFITATWYSLSPISIVINSYLLTETLYLTLLLFAIWILTYWIKQDKYHFLILASIIYSLATLVRPVGLGYLLVPLIILFWKTSGTLIRKITASFIFIAIFFLVLTPWMWRNYQARGIFGLTTLGSDFLLFVNTAYLEADQKGLTYDQARDSIWGQEIAFTSRYKEEHGLTQLTEGQLGSLRLEMALQKIMADPLRYAWVHVKISLNGLRPGLSFLIQLIDSSGGG